MHEERFGLCALEGRTFLSVGSWTIGMDVATGAAPSMHAAKTAPTAPTFSGPFTLKGRYGVPAYPMDAGATYEFNGGGTAGTLGAVKVSGSIGLPGNVLSAHAAGQLMLTNSKGTITLTLTGPTERSFGPMPHRLAYTITGGTGTYAGASGKGTVEVILAARGHKFGLIVHPSK